MATKPSYPPGQGPAALQQELEQLLSSDLASMTLGQLLGMTLSSLCMGERQAHLRGDASDSGNGFYERGVQVGSVPVSVSVPRTRKSEFRPAVLPGPYQRGYPQQMEELLLGLLGSSRSIEGVRRSLRSLGMAVPEDILQDTIDTLSQELELLNSGTLDPDLAVVFMDAKHIEVRIGKRLAKAAIYTCVGIDLEGRKRVLACHVREGPESFGQWKETLRSLLDRGLRRVLLRVQDAFPGLVGLSEGLFPQAEVQFCTVHMLRNARKHLSKKDFRIFHAGWKGVRNAWDPELGARRFEDLCSQFEDRYGTWIAYLRKNRRCLLAFLGYPSRVRASLATTNTAEAVNGQLEILRRNSGGYFQSRRSLQCKLALAVRQLHEVPLEEPGADGVRRTPRAAGALPPALRRLPAGVIHGPPAGWRAPGPSPGRVPSAGRQLAVFPGNGDPPRSEAAPTPCRMPDRGGPGPGSDTVKPAGEHPHLVAPGCWLEGRQLPDPAQAAVPASHPPC